MTVPLLEGIPLLALARLSAVAAGFPMLAGPGAPRHVRLAVALTLAFVLVPAGSAAGPTADPRVVAVFLPFEVLTGLAIGWAFALGFHVLAMAGDFLGQEMGLNTQTQIDPATGRPVPLLARLLEALGLVLFVETGGLEFLLRAVRGSFEVLPPGATVPPTLLAGVMAGDTVATIGAAVALALPAAAVLLVLTTFTTIAARVLPRLHVFDFAFAVRMLTAIFLISLILPRFAPVLAQWSGRLHRHLLEGLAAR